MHYHALEVRFVVLLAHPYCGVYCNFPTGQFTRRLNVVRRFFDCEFNFTLLVEIDHEFGDPLAERLAVFDQHILIVADDAHQLALDFEE